MEEGISSPTVLGALREKGGLLQWPAAVMSVQLQVPCISFIGLL